MKQFAVSRTELAQMLSTSPDMISKYIAEGMPVLATGNGRGRRTMLDLAEVVPWIVSRKTGSFEEARTRQANEQADKLALSNAVTRGQLVKSDDVALEFAEIASNVKARIRRIPDAVADRVVGVKTPHQAKVILLGEIDAALAELARKFTEPPASVDVEDEGEDAD
jgi:phage terminase Nu1 subunit (DNA packaging protein)